MLQAWRIIDKIMGRFASGKISVKKLNEMIDKIYNRRKQE